MLEACKHCGMLPEIASQPNDGRWIGIALREFECDGRCLIQTAVVYKNQLTAVGLRVEDGLTAPKELIQRVFVKI